MIRILIVDDHVLFREGLAAVIRGEPDIEVVGFAGSVKEAVEKALPLKPDIILMDFAMPDGTGAEATRQILRVNPDCRIIFLTMSDQDEDLFAAIRSGAKGYILKNIHPSKLVASLRSVQQGESAISRTMTLRLMEELARSDVPTRPRDPLLAKLTPRELDVLRDVATGMTNQEIATKLFLSENTVKYHVHSILDKLGFADRREASQFARERGLVK
ncbi:MAG: response regulator transcription factor [Anaerolineales bacterium]